MFEQLLPYMEKGELMNQAELAALQTGDLVRNKMSGRTYLVYQNWGERVTVVQMLDLNNPTEWEIAGKACYQQRRPK